MLNEDIIQIGDICPHCKKHKLVYAHSYYPYSDEHLICYGKAGDGCNSTYLIKYKQMWTEEINGLSCDMMDVLEATFEKRGMKLTSEKSDELYEKLQEMLEEFGTGDYRNHN